MQAGGRDLRRVALDVRPDASELQQHDDDSDKEVDGAEGLGLGRHRQRKAALPGGGSEGFFVVEDEVGDAAMEHRDEQADRQPGEFEKHGGIVEREAATLSRAKCLAPTASARLLYNRHIQVLSGFSCILTSKNYWRCKMLTAR